MCYIRTPHIRFECHYSLYRPGLLLGNYDHLIAQPKILHPLQLLFSRTSRATGCNPPNSQTAERLSTYGRPYAHHPWWQGSLPSTARISRGSQTIANWLEDNNFHLQNEPAIPTHHPRNGRCPSTIDLCFSRGSTIQSILTLAVDDNTTSDHCAISVALSLPTGTTLVAPRRCWCRANWETFDSRIQSAKMDLSQLHGMDDTLCAVTNITQLIHQAVDEAVPVKTLRKTAAPGGITV